MSALQLSQIKYPQKEALMKSMAPDSAMQDVM
jgi:hypothetical protein